MTQYSLEKSICRIILLLLAVANTPAATFADEPVTGNERIEVLKMIIAHNEANRQVIETWEGTYHFVDRFPQRIRVQNIPDESGDVKSRQTDGKVEERRVVTIREGLVKIALDVAADKLWTDFQEDAAKTKVVQQDEKQVIEKPKGYLGYEQRTVLVPDSESVLLPNVQYGPVTDIKGDPLQVSSNKLGRLAERKAYPRTLKMNQTDEIVDPRDFYKEGEKYIGESLAVPVDGLLGKYGEEIRSWMDQHTKISKSGAAGSLEYRVTRQFRNGSEPELDAIGLCTSVITFSERDGFLPIEERKLGISGEPCVVRSWRYQQDSGIFVPKEYQYTFNTFKEPRIDKGATLLLDRHLLLVDVTLNGRLPEKVFTADGLNLEKGDRLVDRIEQKLYVHNGSRLVPASQYSESQQRRTGWVLWLNIAALIALVTVFVWRRWRRRYGAHAA